MDETLQQRLRKLGVVKGLSGLKPQAVPPESDSGEGDRTEPAVERSRASRMLQAHILPGGEAVCSGGTFWLWKRTYPAAQFHGCHAIGALAQVPERALAMFGVPDLGARPAFLDTETTGLAGGTGTLAFLVGVGVWNGQELMLHLIFMRRPEEEPAALNYLTQVLSEATGLVTFNGRGFDVPLLETRYILNRMPPVPLDLPHLDLLAVARQLWRDHLASRALGELERHILQVVRTEQDIDSGLIPWLYREYLETGDESDIARVFYHNEVDVLSLASLLVHVAKMVEAPGQMTLAPAEWSGIGRVYDRAGMERDAVAAWQRALSGQDGELDVGCASRLWEDLGVRCRRREAWGEALEIWDAWIESVPGATVPLVEKAKYYEWSLQDFKAALDCTQQALQRAQRWPGGLRRYKELAALQHRYERLVRRQARAAEGTEDIDDESEA